MKAVAVYPGKKNSIHLEDVPKPSLDRIPDGRGVLVKVLRVGVDGTDKEINDAEYGKAPPGDDFLIIDHEYFERGIYLRHGYMTEYYVEDARYLVALPPSLKDVGVLLEPTSVGEK